MLPSMMTRDEDNYGARLRQARVDAHMTLEDVTFILRRDFPLTGRVSMATISRMETNRTSEAAADFLLVSILCSIYDKATAEVSELAEAWRQGALSALSNTRCNAQVPGHRGASPRRQALVGSSPAAA